MYCKMKEKPSSQEKRVRLKLEQKRTMAGEVRESCLSGRGLLS